MAGFKAIVLWFPAGRIALANGWLVMLGALGAVTATAPAEVVVQALGWRGLFALLAGLSALAALLVLFAVPEPTGTRAAPAVVKGVSLWAIYRDRRFWRIAPLSAVGIGTSWSLQGLWAAPWLRDVDGLDRADVVQHLSVMAIAVCFSALLLGMATDRLRRRGVKTESVLASTLVLSMAAQTALVLRMANPGLLALGGDRCRGCRNGSELRNPERVFPEGNVGARQRGPQSAARRRRVRAAVGNRPHHRAVARRERHLSRRCPSGGHGRESLAAAGRARLVRAVDAEPTPAGDAGRGEACGRQSPATAGVGINSLRRLPSGASRAGLPGGRPRDGVLRRRHRPHSASRWQRQWSPRSVTQILLPISSKWIGSIASTHRSTMRDATAADDCRGCRRLRAAATAGSSTPAVRAP